MADITTDLYELLSEDVLKLKEEVSKFNRRVKSVEIRVQSQHAKMWDKIEEMKK